MDKNSIAELAMSRRAILALSTHQFKKLCNFEQPYCWCEAATASFPRPVRHDMTASGRISGRSAATAGPAHVRYVI